MSIAEDPSIDPTANEVLSVALIGAPQSVMFAVTPGPDYDTIKYRYDNTGSYLPYDPLTGIIYNLDDNHELLNIQVTGSGTPAVELTKFTIELPGTDVSATEDSIAEEES